MKTFKIVTPMYSTARTYEAEYSEVLPGGVLHLYNTNEKNQIKTVAYIGPPYDANVS